MGNKKILKIMVSISLILAAFVSVNVFANTPEDKESEMVLKQQDALANNKKIQDKLKDRKDFEARLGGKYIDEEGKLHVNFVGYINSIPEDMKLAGVEYHSVAYTLEELQAIMDTLRDHYKELGDMGAGIDESLNKVLIEIDTGNTEVIEKIKKLVNPEAIEIKHRDPNMKITFF